eukprot:5172674-Amphidinium_carterae.1
MSKDCLQEDCQAPTMMRFPGFLLGGTRGFAARGVASMQEAWNFYFDAAKHMQQVEEEVARYAAAHPHLSALRSIARSLGDGVHAVLD